MSQVPRGVLEAVESMFNQVLMVELVVEGPAEVHVSKRHCIHQDSWPDAKHGDLAWRQKERLE